MIPDPFGTHESYGHHMNSLLCKFLDLFNFEYEFRSATECYKSGVYDEKLLLLLKNYDKNAKKTNEKQLKLSKTKVK
ncbi:unnamed protein product [Onchocerca ochengi]|uniref:DNA-directed RNA polymerase n=1 Tax=Onchocerca ochengi TaxID=42157 RepID=A0A182EB25_ONCOC|nr:unnamed protein product [Onchocerca ochengi]